MGKSHKTTSSGANKASSKGSGATKPAKTTNYSLGSRNMVIAAKNALSRAGCQSASKFDQLSALKFDHPRP